MRKLSSIALLLLSQVILSGAVFPFGKSLFQRKAQEEKCQLFVGSAVSSGGRLLVDKSADHEPKNYSTSSSVRTKHRQISSTEALNALKGGRKLQNDECASDCFSCICYDNCVPVDVSLI